MVRNYTTARVAEARENVDLLGNEGGRGNARVLAHGKRADSESSSE